jgi:hypothetical protein
MSTILTRLSRSTALAPGMFAALLMAGTSAESACPDYVSLPSGTVFNLAALIADAGSPEGALRKAQRALAQVGAYGGCPQSQELAVCEETLAVARKAIVALEACVSSESASGKVRENERAASK